jgi:hypothetical protein
LIYLHGQLSASLYITSQNARLYPPGTKTTKYSAIKAKRPKRRRKRTSRLAATNILLAPLDSLSIPILRCRLHLLQNLKILSLLTARSIITLDFIIFLFLNWGFV